MCGSDMRNGDGEVTEDRINYGGSHRMENLGRKGRLLDLERTTLV